MTFRATRKVMRSPIYNRLVFPGVRLAKTAVDYIRTSQGGYRYSTAVGSHITGFGADEIIIDDPIQPEDAMSESVKQRFRAWRRELRLDSVQRSESWRSCPRDASSRAGRLVRDDGGCGGFHYQVAAHCGKGRTERARHNGRTIFSVSPGSLSIPTFSILKRLKDSGPTFLLMFSPLNTSNVRRPAARACSRSRSGVAMIRRSRRKFELLIHSWDIGATTSGNASVCTTWGLAPNAEGRDAVYLLNVQRLHLELPDVRDAIKAADKRDRPSLIILDERGVGLGVYQELRQEGYRHVEGSTSTSEPMEREGQPGLKPNLSKIDRFGKASLHIADGRVLLPTQAPWLDIFLNEVLGFPNIPDKDQVDSMTQLVGNLDRAIYLARRNKSRGI